MRCGIGLSLILALGACATAPAGDGLAAYPASLVGTYDNAAQYAQAPEDMKRPPIPGDTNDWIDARSVGFTAAPGAHDVQIDWRGADGTGHQEVWSFRTEAGKVRMDIRKLGAADGPDPACALAVTGGADGWNAQTDPEVCTVQVAAGEVAIDTRITVMRTGILYQTAGRLADGTYVFRTPGGPPYDLRRRP